MSEPLGAQAYMAKARRALRGARLLADAGDWEGACARAYYAMYDAARAALSSIAGDATATNTRTHRGLISAFGLLIVRPGHLDAELGRSLNQVQQTRLVADYTGDDIGQTDSAWAIGQAEVFLETIQRKMDELGAP